MMSMIATSVKGGSGTYLDPIIAQQTEGLCFMYPKIMDLMGSKPARDKA